MIAQIGEQSIIIAVKNSPVSFIPNNNEDIKFSVHDALPE